MLLGLVISLLVGKVVMLLLLDIPGILASLLVGKLVGLLLMGILVSLLI